jgi:hypothetical protein
VQKKDKRGHWSGRADGTSDSNIRTAAAKELREHVERVCVLMLATLVGLQALLAMSVVYLPFLFSISVSTQSFLSEIVRLTVGSERISYAAMRGMMSRPRIWRPSPEGRLTVRDLYKLILRISLVILVGVIFTTETFVSLFNVLFRRGPVHCSAKPKSGILFLSATVSYAQSRTLYKSAALMSTAHASNAKRIKSGLRAI